MTNYVLVLLLVALSICNIESLAILAKQGTSFEEHEVVPDIIAATPDAVLGVLFPSGASVAEGNVLTLDDVASLPTLEWKADPESYYTVIMCDADAPSRQNPDARCYLHWLVINVPGLDVASGDTVVDFLSSHPGPETGLHRYVLLIYLQPEHTVFDELPNGVDGRRRFSPTSFSEKFGLGNAVAGNFYQTQTIE